MKLFLLLPALLMSFMAFADEDLSRLNPLSGRAFFKNAELKPGELADLQIEVNLQEGFFAYHNRFRLKTKNVDATVGELFIDPIVEFDDTVSKKKKKGVHKKATITTQVEIPTNLKDLDQIDFELTYIACTKKFCLTPRILALSTPIKLIETETAESVELGSSAYIQEQIDKNLAYALLLIFFFGLLTSLTPCVYPLIPITLAVLGTNDKRSRFSSFTISLTYVLGIGLTYAFLGVVAAQTGQLFGSLISHPIVVIAMSLIFFTMGLSLLGFFEIQPPAFIRNRMANADTGRGYPGAFASGLLAGIVASPCVGPVLVGVLAYIAKSQDAFLGFIMLYTFALGFGTLLIFVGTFSQMANRIPRSGSWMNTIKTVLAFVLFGLSFYYAWPLAKQQLKAAGYFQQKSEWQKFSEAKVEAATKAGQPIIIDFYADWCVACGELDEFTFSQKQFKEATKNFALLKVDATAPTPDVQEITKKYKVYGLPTILFIDSKGEVREDMTLTGFEEIDPFMERIKPLLSD